MRPPLDRNKMDGKQYHELDKRIEVLSRDMNTKQAEYKTDIANLSKENAQRDTRNLLAIAGMIALAVAILGFIFK